MADTVGIHRFDLHYDELIVQQLSDGTVKVNKGLAMQSAATPAATDTVGLHVFESNVGSDKVVQQLGDGSVKLNVF